MKNNKKTYNNNNKILFKIHMIYRIMSLKKILYHKNKIIMIILEIILEILNIHLKKI